MIVRKSYGFFYEGFLSAVLIRSMGITGGVQDLGVEPRHLVEATAEKFFGDLQQLRSVYFYDSTKWFIQFGGDLFGRFIGVEESRVKFRGVDSKLRKEAYGRNFTILQFYNVDDLCGGSLYGL